MVCRSAHLLCQVAVGKASRADGGSHLRGIQFSFAQSFHKDIHEESRLPTIQVAKTVHYEQLSQLALSTILCAFRKPHLCPNVNYLLYNQNKRINNHIIIIKSYFFISLHMTFYITFYNYDKESRTYHRTAQHTVNPPVRVCGYCAFHPFACFVQR